jgi:hypothetical protein
MCQYKYKYNAPPHFFPFLFFFSGVALPTREKGPPRSPDSLYFWHPVYMSHDKTWRKPDRVIASLKYGERTHQRNPADVLTGPPRPPMTLTPQFEASRWWNQILGNQNDGKRKNGKNRIIYLCGLKNLLFTSLSRPMHYFRDFPCQSLKISKVSLVVMGS